MTLDDLREEERRDAIREDKIDAWWERWGCRACETTKRVLCECNYREETEEIHCDACGFTGFVTCEECEGKGHLYEGRRLP
jgi:hypothetical protein